MNKKWYAGLAGAGAAALLSATLVGGTAPSAGAASTPPEYGCANQGKAGYPMSVPVSMADVSQRIVYVNDPEEEELAIYHRASTTLSAAGSPLPADAGTFEGWVAASDFGAKPAYAGSATMAQGRARLTTDVELSTFAFRPASGTVYCGVVR